MGKLIKEFSLKECWLRSPSQHQKRPFNIIFGWHVTSEEWWARYCCLLHALEMYYSPCLSTWLHLRCSYRMKILPVVVSIVFCYQKYIICDKVPSPFLNWPISCCVNGGTSGGYWYKHKLEGAMYSSNLSFRKYIPRAINPPPALQKVKVATASMW